MEMEVDIPEVKEQVQSTEDSAPVRPEAKQLQFKYTKDKQLELVFDVKNGKRVAAADKRARKSFMKNQKRK
jgi:hypothetical protein